MKRLSIKARVTFWYTLLVALIALLADGAWVDFINDLTLTAEDVAAIEEHYTPHAVVGAL